MAPYSTSVPLSTASVSHRGFRVSCAFLRVTSNPLHHTPFIAHSMEDSKRSRNNVEMRAIDDEIRDLEFDRNTTAAKQWATPHDIKDMDALGLTPTFKRRFKFVAMVGFSSTVVVAWQNMLAVFYFALYNGGTGGLFWGFVFSMSAMTFVYLTIAELSSW